VTILCEPDPRRAAALTAVADGEVVAVETLGEAGRLLAASQPGTPVVLGPGVDLDHALRFASDVRAAGMDAKLVLVREAVTGRLRERAAAAGVGTVVAADDRVALAAAFRRPARPRRATGRVITVLGARDGYGKTTVAINLAAALHAAGAARVCLVDLDLAFSDLAGALSLTPKRSLAQAISRHPTLTRAVIGTLVTPAWPGVDCLIAATAPGEATRVPTAAVADLLTVLPGGYDFVVVDTVERCPAHALVATDRSQHHVLVTTPEVPALRRLRFTLDVLDLLPYGRTPRSVVLNRVHPGLRLPDVEEILRCPVAAELPSTPDIPESVNRGEALAAVRPRHPFSAAIRTFAETHVLPTKVPTNKGNDHA
jgi:Flp pilus assembly CpaE family ATPase